MRKQKVTGWFPGTTAPHRNGVYELTRAKGETYFARFADGIWFSTSRTAQRAEDAQSASLWPTPTDRDHACWKWRGLAKEPKHG